jgi:hypothetical protein
VAKVDSLGMGLVHGLAVEGAAQLLHALLADPLAGDETLQNWGHVALSEKNKARFIRINQPSGRLILVVLSKLQTHLCQGISPTLPP